jgi:hypothetical protein
MVRVIGNALSRLSRVGLAIRHKHLAFDSSPDWMLPLCRWFPSRFKFSILPFIQTYRAAFSRSHKEAILSR